MSDAPPESGQAAETTAGSPMGKGFMGRVLLGLVLGLVVYGCMALWSDLDSIRAALADFPLWLIPAATGLSFANYLLRFLRWERYRGLLGVQLDRRTSFLIHLSGLALTVTPGKMGEALKSILIRQVEGSPLARTAPIVVAERFTDLLGFLVLVAVGGLATAPEHAWVFWATLGLCAVLLAILAYEPMGKATCSLLARLPLVGGLAPSLRTAISSTRTLMAPRELPLATIVATIGWGLECTAFWLIANALVPGEFPLLFGVYAFAISAVAGAVVIFTPGGLGVTEGLLTALTSTRYQSMGMPAAAAGGAAVSATVLIRLCTLWFAMGLGMVALAIFTHRTASTDN
ncbi:MAG: lysylphosphatidylglycerol synthase transmembrane domain-containing protein [Planctomycetota bacterium]|nr:lysylphosphatidylglycerol synthase transmembrane domain-containing protein [Planctomycetota bacterium]